MASSLSKAASNRKDAITQAILMLFMALFWVPFLFSAWNYKDVSWFHYLLLARWTLLLVPLLAIPVVLVQKKPIRGFEFHYYLVAMALQASQGILEPANQIDFYSYTSLLLLLSSLGYQGTFRRWFVAYLPFIAVVHVVPLFFKDHIFFTSVGMFVDKFTFNVALATLSVVIVRMSAEKFAVLEENIQLHLALLAEKDIRLQVVEAELAKAAKRIEEGASSVAIARTTTMLAHDVRKPFSMLKMALGMMGRASDPAGVKAVLVKIVPEVNRAMGQVNGMLEDLLEVGSTSTELIQEPVSPEALIEQTLGEIFRVYPKADVSVAYRFGHSHAVNVHAQKVGRVFSNIVGNAVQAMNMRGQVWFATRETMIAGRPFVEFTLGNAGSVIPPENLTKLFEAFFTSGKKGGTGLGLAIAQKVVTAHGGRIWCESERTEAHPEGQVEFKFTLPVALGQAAQAAGKLPHHSSEVTRELLAEGDQPTPTSPDATELALEAAIFDLAKAKGRSLKVLVVDDESIYRAALASSLARTPDLASAVSVAEAQDGAEGLAKLLAQPDLVITDVDMGHQVDGFDLVEAMRAAGFKGLVCVHSNRMVAEDHRAAFESGADAFIPKPMARAQLLKLVIQAGQKATVPERQGAVAVADLAGKPEVLVVEDNIFIQEAWRFALGNEATVHTLGSYEELVERLDTEPGFVSRLMLAVTDMYLDKSAGDGLDVGRLLKKHHSKLRVLLSSDGVIPLTDLLGAIDRTIGKAPVNLGTLRSL